MSLTSDLSAIKTVHDGVNNNKVTRFAYTAEAYANNDVAGHTDYDPTRGNNIPTDAISVLEVNQTVVDKGYRARASSLTRMLLNHIFGRVSYNLNKVNDLFNNLISVITSNLGVADGIATLDSSGRLPSSQLTEDVMEYKGEWNASTNTPTLADGTGNIGDTYKVSVGGSHTFGGESILFFAGDRVVCNGSSWVQFPTGAVRTVSEVGFDSNGNVDLSSQTDVTKILNSAFLGKLLSPFMARKWTHGTGDNTSYTFRAVQHANGIWVAGSDSHGLWWSTDGKAWTQGTGGNTSYSIKDVYYENGIWVACSSANGLWWSTDGKAWTQGTGGNTGYTFNSAYCNGSIWVACSKTNGLWWSTDGKAWTQGTGTAVDAVNFSKVYYGNAIWVACCDNYGLWWSTDGKAWTQGTGDNTSYAFMTVFYANGIWVAGSYSHGVWWSTNGKAWTQGTGVTTNSVYSICYANGIWLIGFYLLGLWYSTDGKSWSSASGLSSSEVVYAIQYANTVFVCCTLSGLYWSTDGKAWSGATGDGDYTFFCDYQNDGVWVAGSNSHGLWYSSVNEALEYME